MKLASGLGPVLAVIRGLAREQRLQRKRRLLKLVSDVERRAPGGRLSRSAERSRGSIRLTP